MSECDDLTGDELAECQENRARRNQFVDHIGHRLIDHAFNSMADSGSAGEAAGLAGAAAGAEGASAASGVGSLLGALPEALALATGGKADGRAARYAKARRELEQIHARLKRAEAKHVGTVEGEDHRRHAGRPARRSRHSSGGAPGTPEPGWRDHIDTSRSARRRG